MLYHASAAAGLTELTPRVSTHGEAYVYAIDSAVTALLFGAPKDDFDLLMDEENGVPELWECRPDALRAIYAGKSCSLYTVPEEGFLAGQTGWEPERVCRTPVPVVREERVPDLYEWLTAAQARGEVVIHAFRADADYHAFLLEEFRERIAAFGLTEQAVRADARFAPFWDELFPAEKNDQTEENAMRTEVTVAQMKELERVADAAGLSYRQMMENAGAAAARVLMSRLPGLKSAAVFCGSGNNGGDGYVLARLLHRAGVSITIITVQGAAKTADAIANAEAAAALGIPVFALDSLTPEQEQALTQADAAVDALYGTGFHGELAPAALRAASLMNACRFVLALDVPSGVAADTGETARGSVRATVTVSFHAPKACHRLAAAQCGETVTADIGIRV